MGKVLVVEDEPSIMTLLQYNLEKVGFDVITASDGIAGLEIARNEKLDIIILDLMLPGMDGIDLCKTLRQEKIKTPILMLTARDDELDKILGLELGADDYMTKPFSPREVIARVKAILRRATPSLDQEEQTEKVIQFGTVKIYPDEYKVERSGELLDLTPKEFELLLYLAQHQGKVLSRQQLLDSVWNYDFVGDSRIVDVHISNLRDKIEDDTKKPVYIKTIRGFGYKLEKL